MGTSNQHCVIILTNMKKKQICQQRKTKRHIDTANQQT